MTQATKMPKEVAEIHDVLSRELSVLYTKWNDFKLLFCTSNESVKLLDSAASFFFQICQEVMSDDIVITVCRLTDSATTQVGGITKNNLTVAHLISIIPEAAGGLKKTLESMAKSAAVSWSKFRNHRNTRIGHCDLHTKLKRAEPALPGIKTSEVGLALQNISQLLNAIERHYDRKEFPFEDGIYGAGNGSDLLKFIKRKEELERYFNHKESGRPS